MENEILDLIDRYWKFDNSQAPVSNWHDKQDLLEAVRKALNKLTNVDWYNMEEAPKDGTRILMVEDKEVFLVSWRQFQLHYPGKNKFTAWCVDGSEQDEQGGCQTLDRPEKWCYLPKI